MGMNMRQNLMDVYKILNSDEKLLRLLYYKPINFSDNPLSPTKVNILDMSNKWEIINDVIVPGMKTDDLESLQKCRIMIFMGDRDQLRNDSFASQSATVDILVGIDYDNIDFRLCWICDRVNELLFDENATGLSKLKFKKGRTIGCPKGYVGYRMLYTFTDFQ